MLGRRGREAHWRKERKGEEEQEIETAGDWETKKRTGGRDGGKNESLGGQKERRVFSINH